MPNKNIQTDSHVCLQTFMFVYVHTYIHTEMHFSLETYIILELSISIFFRFVYFQISRMSILLVIWISDNPGSMEITQIWYDGVGFSLCLYQ